MDAVVCARAVGLRAQIAFPVDPGMPVRVEMAAVFAGPAHGVAPIERNARIVLVRKAYLLFGLSPRDLSKFELLGHFIPAAFFPSKSAIAFC